MNIFRYYRTLKYLKLSQIFRRIIFRYYRPKIALTSPPTLRNLKNPWVKPILKSSLYEGNHFKFAQEKRDISAPGIWNDAKLDSLWLYNLHYFSTPSVELIRRWIKENPPTKGCGWESYPLSLRIVNWIKWILDGNTPDELILKSLAIQARYLMRRLEYHLLGNHLLANAKALIFAGCFFSGKEAGQWLNKGLAILKREIPEQILPDGGHFERSPMYHSIILEDLLDLKNIMQTFGIQLATWKSIVPKMFVWLRAMAYENHELSFFNDTTTNIAAPISALNAYANRLRFTVDISTKPLLHLKESGFCRIVKNNAILVTDIGSIKPDYIPGHAHAETLSFELCIAQQKILVNSGISCYGENSQRYLQRSTKAHNCVMIDQENSSEVWNSFRVGRRARVKDVTVTEINDVAQITAMHDGYRHLSGSPRHKRTWAMQTGKLLIKDEILGRAGHEIYQFFHVHPDVTVEQQTANEWLLRSKSTTIKIILDQMTAPLLQDSFYYSEFGKADPKFTLMTRCNVKLPVSLLTLIEW